MGGRGRGGHRGGNKRGRTQRRDFRDGRPNVWKKPRPDGDEAPRPEDGEARAGNGRPGWETFVMESSAFDTYYKKQEIVSPEEWDTFIDTLRKPLPSSFRINGSGQFAQSIRDQLQHDFVDLLKDDLEIDGQRLKPIMPLDWYPDNLAWVLQASRMQLRKLPLLEKIHEFLKQENELGSITRQEVVSMIPPLVLDVKPHHRVLDMCAAPGSKTFQLLEMIHKEDTRGILPEGMVVANDLDVQRCHLLIHQTKRMCSPNILVTNHEGQHFPSLRAKWKESKAQAHRSGTDVDYERGQMFDRILCDVPCSGDGTIRKAPDLWKKWHSGLGNGVHRLQIQIAMRGVALLRVGGRLVYSTCSLNPIEDEAVVGELLRQSEGSLELLDVSSEIRGLRFRPGLKSWKVRDKRKWLCTSSEVNRHRAGVIVPSMFPSGKGWDRSDTLDGDVPKSDANPDVSLDEVFSEESQNENEELTLGEAEVSDLPLERCMRILPHDQNTGGFFIAVFQKISALKVQPRSNEDQTQSSQKRFASMPAKNDAVDHLSAETNVQEIDAPSVEANVQDIDAPSVEGIVQDIDAPSVEANVKDIDAPSVEANVQDIDAPSVEANVQDIDAPSVEANVQETDALSADATLHDTTRDSTSGRTYGSDSGALDDTIPCTNEADEIESTTCASIDVNAEPQDRSITSGGTDGKSRIQQQGRWKGVDPVLILEDEQVLESLISYYGIRDSFPLRGHLITRSEDISRLKRIYYVSKSVAEAIETNRRSGGQLKITSAGLKIFERQAPKEGVSLCAFRIASEGLPCLLPHMTKQIVHINHKDFKLLLSSKAVPFHAFQNSDFSSAIQKVLPGCCVIILPKWLDNGEVDFIKSIAVGCWRGRNNVSLLVTKTEVEQFLQRLPLAADDS